MPQPLNEMLLDALLCIKQVPRSERRNRGLCAECVYMVRDQYSPPEVYDRLYSLFQLWPKFSGQDDYPIPDPDGKEAPDDIFNRTYSQNIQWYGPYGDLRVELLDFLIEVLTEQRPQLDVIQGRSLSVIFVDDIK